MFIIHKKFEISLYDTCSFLWLIVSKVKLYSHYALNFLKHAKKLSRKEFLGNMLLLNFFNTYLLELLVRVKKKFQVEITSLQKNAKNNDVLLTLIDTCFSFNLFRNRFRKNTNCLCIECSDMWAIAIKALW